MREITILILFWALFKFLIFRHYLKLLICLLYAEYLSFAWLNITNPILVFISFSEYLSVSNVLYTIFYIILQYSFLLILLYLMLKRKNEDFLFQYLYYFLSFFFVLSSLYILGVFNPRGDRAENWNFSDKVTCWLWKNLRKITPPPNPFAPTPLPP